MKRLFLFFLFIVHYCNILFAASVSFGGNIRNATNNAPVSNYTVFFRFSQPALLPPNFSINGYAIQTNPDGKYVFSLDNLLPNVQYHAEIYVYDKSFQIAKKSFSFYANNCAYIVQTIYIIPITSFNTKVRFLHEQPCQSCPAYLQFKNVSTSNLLNYPHTHWEWKVNNEPFSSALHPDFFVRKAEQQFITLKATAYDSISGLPFYSESFSMPIPDNARQTFHVGGQIFQGNIPVSTAQAILYANTCHDYIPIDTMTTVQYGYYYFTALTNCSYIIQAIPEHLTKNKNILYIPTYYPDKPFWSQAQPVNLQNASSTETIHLVQVQSTSGQFAIQGNITFSDHTPAHCLLYLHNEAMNIIQYDFSDHQGFFKFNNIPPGLYYITYELPGFTSALYPVQISTSSVSNIHITIEHTTSIPTLTSNTLQFILYPVPATDIIHILFPETESTSPSEYLYYIRNIYGQLTNEGILRASSQTPAAIDVSALSNGYYIIELLNKDNHSYHTSKFIILR